MLEVLTQNFVPDQLKDYSQKNFKESSSNKLFNPTIPTFLQNMPTDVIKHLLKRIENANTVRNEDIKEQSSLDLCFKVRSESYSDEWYNVNFASGPNCDCPDFQKHYLVCKHLFAIMKHKEKTWEDLPEVYRNSPYLKLQPFFLSGNREPDQEPVVTETPLCWDTTCTTPTDTETFAGVENMDGKKISNVLQERKKLQAALKELLGASYLCEDDQILMEITKEVTKLVKKAEKGICKESGLPLETQQEHSTQGATRKERKKFKGRSVILCQINKCSKMLQLIHLRFW